ncbi:serine dehydratase subunit alpha family protein [bacterium]|nr:serine dehydratase subunit alpha family protein [bacterium]
MDAEQNLSKKGYSCCNGMCVCTQDTPNRKLILDILSHEVSFTFGCTELGVIALAGAHARTHCPGKIVSIEMKTSEEVYLNAKTAGIPGTNGRLGIELITALGVIAGNAEHGLRVLETISERHIPSAQALIDSGKISCHSIPRPDVFVDLTLKTEGNQCRVVIHGTHTNIIFCSACQSDETALENAQVAKAPGQMPYQRQLCEISFRDVIAIGKDLPADCFDYLLAGVAVNREAAQAFGSDLPEKYNLGGLNEQDGEVWIAAGLAIEISRLTATVASARMRGARVQIMSSGCSGNQGVVGILIPAEIGRIKNAPRDIVARGVFLSHLMNAKIKAHVGMTSAQCGVAIGASVGAALGGIYVMNETTGVKNYDDQMVNAFNFIISGLAGMVCDGAKPGCATKVETGSLVAVRAIYASRDRDFPFNEFGGIVDANPDKTIDNLARLSNAMSAVKGEIISILGGN